MQSCHGPMDYNMTEYLVFKSWHNWKQKVFLKYQIKTPEWNFRWNKKSCPSVLWRLWEQPYNTGSWRFFYYCAKSVQTKWLLRYNTNELYTEYKFEHPNNKIYWSTFESLHLKRCITVAATGSPSVCLCLYHQKVKLMLDGCKFPVDQHSLIEMIVCSRSNCGKSPWLEPLYEHWL